MKKHIVNVLLISLLINLSAPVTFAQNKLNSILPNKLKQESTGVYVELEKSVISSKLEKELKDEIEKVYGKENVDTIYSKIVEIAKIAKQNRPQNLKDEDLSRESDWYKDQVIYMFYVDQFGTVSPEKPNKFNDTVGMLGYLKQLGVTTIYMLPFADSPMEDAGFDVKNPQDVRKDLGGRPQFENFIKKAKEQGFNIKADLVLNHFSDQHEWFQQALKGDENKVNRFVVRDSMPEYTRYVDTKLGTVAEYKEDNGEISKRRIIFPEITEHNWRKETINGKDRYFYHTFYPFQLDINWENPEVLYYNLETINYWANLGVDIFRLDAIPYLSKEVGTN